MSLSRPSYRPVSGGKFSIHNAVKRAKKVGKKARHTVGRAQQLAEQNSHLIDQFDQQFDTNISKGVRQANNSIARAEEIASQVDGGKFHLNRVLRKAGHSVQKARSIARKAAPMLALAAPEIGLPLEAALLATGGRVRAKAAKKGGSFLAQGGAIGGSELPHLRVEYRKSFPLQSRSPNAPILQPKKAQDLHRTHPHELSPTLSRLMPNRFWGKVSTAILSYWCQSARKPVVLKSI